METRLNHRCASPSVCAQERTERIIRLSWDLGKKIQWRGAFLCWLRDQVIRWTPLSWHVADLEAHHRAGLC